MSEIIDIERVQALRARAISDPLLEHIYIADPSAHVFEGRIYIYSSHDIESDTPRSDEGDHFAMVDYHVVSLARPEAEAIDHGVALHVDDVPWAARQMWAPDAACKDGKYYLYFPAKRPDGIFQIGVAVGERPSGPFVPEPAPIEGSYSIDTAVFEDRGEFYLYFGGIWGGQLQKYRDNVYDEAFDEPAPHEPALGARVARLAADMKGFAEAPREVLVLDQDGKALLAGDHERRFFEAPWMHRHAGKYYFSYSTGNTHLLCYAVGDHPYGPFTYRGRILMPVIGWTTHHSICEFEGRTWLFYHDSSLSEGISHLRSVKVTELFYDEHGDIVTVAPYGEV